MKKCTNCENFILSRCETSVPCIRGNQWKAKKIDYCCDCPFGPNHCIYSINAPTVEDVNEGKFEVFVPGMRCPQNAEKNTTETFGLSFDELEMMIAIFKNNGHKFPDIMDYASGFGDGMYTAETAIKKQYEDVCKNFLKGEKE